MTTTTAAKVCRWDELPATELLGGTMRRTGFRGDHCLLTFNRIQPTMQRWEPHSHPFDQIVLTVEGTQTLEIDGETMVCGPGTVVRVPGDAKHTGWPISDGPVLNIDVFPPREDYLFLTKHQSEYPQPDAETVIRHPQQPTDETFVGKPMEDTSDILFRWAELPREEMSGGAVSRAGFRGDHALLVFNWIRPGGKRPEPQADPFDRVVAVLQGALAVEIDGQVTECSAGSVLRVPPGAAYAAWAAGDREALNLDVFAPPRQDCLHLTKYQTEFA